MKYQIMKVHICKNQIMYYHRLKEVEVGAVNYSIQDLMDRVKWNVI